MTTSTKTNRKGQFRLVGAHHGRLPSTLRSPALSSGRHQHLRPRRHGDPRWQICHRWPSSLFFRFFSFFFFWGGGGSDDVVWPRFARRRPSLCCHSNCNSFRVSRSDSTWFNWVLLFCILLDFKVQQCRLGGFSWVLEFGEFFLVLPILIDGFLEFYRVFYLVSNFVNAVSAFSIGFHGIWSKFSSFS